MDILVVLEDKNGNIHLMSQEAIAGAQQIGGECGLSIGVLALGGKRTCTCKTSIPICRGRNSISGK